MAPVPMTNDIAAGGERAAVALPAGRPWRVHHIFLAAGAVAFLVWCADGVDLRPSELARAIPVIGVYFGRMWPPRWGFAEAIWRPALETIYVAIWGNVLATIIGLPL